jgi:hypothetical protein
MLNFEEEKAITIDLLEEESIQTEVADINYIPSYKVAETERQANEKERIANEEEREAAYNKLTEMIKEGKVTGIYIGEEQPTDVFTEVWIDPNGNPEVEASKIVFSDNETLQTKYENGELKGDKGDKGEDGTDGYTPVKGVDYFTEEDKQSLNIPTNEQTLNLIYPVGAVYISETNTNPSTLFGGEWNLVNKEFSSAKGSDTGTGTYFSKDSTNVSSYGLYFRRNCTNVDIRLMVKNAVELSDEKVILGNILFEALGFSGLYYSLYSHLGGTDGGNAVVQCTLMYNNGEVSANDVVHKEAGSNVAVDSEVYFEFSLTIPMEYMLDSACDKFYWKRVS